MRRSINLYPLVLVIAGAMVAVACNAGATPTAMPTPGQPTPTPPQVGQFTPTEQATPAAITPGSTPAPTTPRAGLLSPIELKYHLFDTYGEPQYCDPDIYPIAREDEEKLALERFPDIQKNAEEYGIILRRYNLDKQSTFSPEQKLLIYREHKKLTFGISLEPSGADFSFQLVAGKSPEDAHKFEGLITRSGSITVTNKQPTVVNCPICLAGDTLIDTPGGPVAVKDLRKGTAVWTADASRARRAALVVETVKREVPLTHQMVRLVLSDGRSLFVSPGHPTADGRPIADLFAGDVLDGACIVTVERVPYEEAATYDILPSGETGAYWANGILIGSTLAPSNKITPTPAGQR